MQNRYGYHDNWDPRIMILDGRYEATRQPGKVLQLADYCPRRIRDLMDFDLLVRPSSSDAYSSWGTESPASKTEECVWNTFPIAGINGSQVLVTQERNASVYL